MSKQSDLVGFTQGSVKLTVDANSTEEDVVLIQDSNDVDVASLRINNGAFIVKGKNASQPVQLQTHDGNEDIEVDPDGFIKMETAGVERMRIDSSGNTMINTTVVHGTNSKVSVKTDTDKSGIGITAYKSANTNYYFMNFIANTTSVGDIYSNGTSTTYATSSDYRLKENVVSVSDASTRLKQLNPVRFNFIADPSTTVDGFLAHEVQAIVPEAIKGVKDGMKTEEYEVTPAVYDDEGNLVTEAVMGEREVPDYQGIDQSKLVPLLTAALQEALQKIDALEARVAALETV